MISVALDVKQHNRNSFDCGVEALNNYLKLTANQQSNKDNSRTYILEDNENDNFIIGFYTLTMANIDLSYPIIEYSTANDNVIHCVFLFLFCRSL